MDARALTEPVDRRTARAYVKQLKASGRMPSASPVGLIIGVAVFAVFLLMFGTVFIGIIGSILSMRAGGFAAVVPVLVFAALVVGAGFVIWGLFTGRIGSGPLRAYRLDRFAQANGMTWYPEAKAPALPGMIFDAGHSRVATDILRGDRPRLVEFANYRYKTGSGKNESTHTWGYVAVKLANPLPHIVLDATGNNGWFGSNLPESFDKHQRLSLEGDFDRYFALYCPAGYERDALYLFTPDIMARFVDNAAALDVEIVDDWLFLYAQRDLSTLDPATWEWLFSVVRSLLDKLAQWERWRDDRLMDAAAVPGAASLPFAAAPGVLTPPTAPPAGVAPGGRRLKSRFSVFGLILVVGFLVIWAWSFLAPLITAVVGSVGGR